MARDDTRSFLLIAHPGHELRVHGWLEKARPRVLVLTDGSGRTGRSRLPSTSAVLAAAGATPGTTYGGLTDRAVYDAIIGGDLGLFRGLVAAVADELRAGGADLVVGDRLEGYNPAHDLCRYVIDAAVAIVARSGRQAIRSLDFPLTGRPNGDPSEDAPGTVHVVLDDAAFARKVAAARTYRELDAEVAAILAAGTIEVFREERLRPVRPVEAPPEVPPYYERYGEGQVAAGHYATVLRFEQHVAPIARALRREAGLAP